MNKEDNPAWQDIIDIMNAKFGVTDFTAILLFVGIQELGQGFKKYNKQEKTDLIHIATCKVLSYNNYYKFTGFDNDNWPVWEKVNSLPKLSVKEQEGLLIKGIIAYFKENNLLKKT
ncbi:MAG: hypothetical protein GXO79_01040 [Chlorobi bacterium]|nr:hypothetical protein [Chlorobiota bacterium]